MKDFENAEREPGKPVFSIEAEFGNMKYDMHQFKGSDRLDTLYIPDRNQRLTDVIEDHDLPTNTLHELNDQTTGENHVFVRKTLGEVGFGTDEIKDYMRDLGSEPDTNTVGFSNGNIRIGFCKPDEILHTIARSGFGEEVQIYIPIAVEARTEEE